MFRLSSRIATFTPLILLSPGLGWAQETAPPVAAETTEEEPPTLDASTEETASPAAPAPQSTPELAAEPAPEEPITQTPPEPLAPEPLAPAPASVTAPPPALLVAEEPPAPSPLPLTVGGDVWSRFELRQNYDELGASRARFREGEATFFRTRMTFKTNPLPLIEGLSGHLYFAPQASGNWGTNGAGGTVGEASLGIYEGYFQLTSELLAFKAGRFAMNYGEALIIGNLDWHQSGRAFDGAMLSITPGQALIDLFVTQQAEGLVATTNPAFQNKPFLAGDDYFWGVYAQVGAAIAEGFGLDFYALGRSAVARDIITQGTDMDGEPIEVRSHVNSATFMTIGARVKQTIGVFDYRAEAGVQVGKSPRGTEPLNKFAYQGDLEIGVSPVKGLRIALNGAFASGDGDPLDGQDQAYDELYPTTHKWMGLMDIIGVRSNIATGVLKLSYAAPSGTVFMVDGHVFARPETTAESNLSGFEVDAQILQKLGKFAHVRGLYGIFLPQEDMYGSVVAAHYVELQAGVKF